MSDPKAESIALFYTNESSDKEYHVHLKSEGALWLVEIQYGRRGSALRSSLKTKSPIDFDKAKAAYDKIVREQLRDGYTPSATGAAYQGTPSEKTYTGTLPQLLNSVDEAGFEDYLTHPDWMLQEKFDGERLMMRKENGAIQGTNRNGIAIAIPVAFEEALGLLQCDQCIVDSEWLGDRVAVFDILELNGVDLRSTGAKKRKEILDALLSTAPHDAIILVETALDEAAKRELHGRVKAAGGEGVVGKKISSHYVVGRPNSGGDQIKRKFVESCTVVVMSQHPTKRSVGVGGHADGSTLIDLGSVTIPSNHEIPAIGAIVEVHYLYAYKEGSLYQPVYKGARRDQLLADCNLGQLKYKSDGPATAPKTARPARH